MASNLFSNETEDKEHQKLSCKICDKDFTTVLLYKQHFASKKHYKMYLKKTLSKDLLKQFMEDDTHQDPKCIQCTTCNIEFSGPENYKDHMEGVKHKKKLLQIKAEEELGKLNIGGNHTHCDVCDISFTGIIPYNQHLQSASHTRGLQRAEDKRNFEDSKEENGKYRCKMCQKQFTCASSLKSHMKNNKHENLEHKANLRKIVANDPDIIIVKAGQREILQCVLCHMSFTGPESARDHLESQKHLQVKIEQNEREEILGKIEDLSICEDKDASVSSVQGNSNGGL